MLEHCREFVVLAKTLSFGTAAAKLNLSQPTLSRHIAELEHDVGFRLLDRKPVALTPAGEYFLSHLCEALDSLDKAISKAQTISRGGKSAISVKMTPGATIISKIVYDAFSCVRAFVPDVSLHVLNEKTQNMIDAVASGDADVSLVHADPHLEGFSCERLVDYPLDVWGHRESPLCGQSNLRIEDLGDYKLKASTYPIFDEWLEIQKTVLRRKGMEPKERLKPLETLNDFALTLQTDEIMIAGSINIDPSASINPDLVQLHIQDPALKTTAYLLYRTDPENEVLQKFVTACHEMAARETSSAGINQTSI